MPPASRRAPRGLLFSVAATAVVLAGCGAGGNGAPAPPVSPTPAPAPAPPPPPPPPPTFTVGGTITGLRGAAGVVLANAAEQLSVAADGAFTFATAVPAGTAYGVSVATQPADPAQTCVVANGSGVIASANVDTVQITCTTRTFSIGGSVSGLASATGLVLRNNGADDLAIAADGLFTFATPVASGADYAVSVAAQPAGATCTPSQGNGTVAAEAVTNVVIACSALTHTIGGSVTGLAAQDPSSAGLVLVNNAGERLSVRASGAFVFPTPVAHGAAYTVAVATQPTSPAQTCLVDPATAHGDNVTTDVTTVAVQCLAVNTAGNLDPAFGNNGVVLIDFEAALGLDTLPAAVLVPADGSIVLAGTTDQAASKDFALLRVDAGGARDSTFNGGANNGYVRTNFTTAGGSNRIDHARAIVRQADGRLVVAGYTSSWDLAVARYLASGALDTSFGTGGKTVVSIGTVDFGFALAIDGAGRVVIAGTSPGTGEDFALLRLTAAGTPDPTFNGGDPANTTGTVRTHISRDDRAQAVAIQPDGKIVAAGYANGASSDFAVVRYLDDGRLDGTFGAAGTGKVTIDLGSVDRAAALVLQPDGAIVVGGFSGVGFGIDFALVRLTAGGVLDTTFNGGGVVRTDVAGNDDRINAIALDASGRIVVAGSSHNGLNTDIALARYSTAGVLDPTFGVGGIVVSPVSGGNDDATGVLVQPDGKIVVVGQADNGTNGANINVDFALIRVLP